MPRKKRIEVQPEQSAQQTQQSIWKRVSDDSPVLLSEYDLKGFMLKSDKAAVMNIQDFMKRQLQQSNIPKREVAIFRMQMECMISWFGMGLHDVANEEFVELLTELDLNNSVGGHKTILNLAQVGASVSMLPGEAAEIRMGHDQEYQEQQEGLPQKLRRKLMGG